MASLIEKALYGNQGTHGVFEFCLVTGCIHLRVAPWVEPASWVLATFVNVKLSSLTAYPSEFINDDLDMPWDIIAFDCYEQPTGRWQFVLHCSSVEWCFESDWPEIERRSAESNPAPGL